MCGPGKIGVSPSVRRGSSTGDSKGTLARGRRGRCEVAIRREGEGVILPAAPRPPVPRRGAPVAVVPFPHPFPSGQPPTVRQGKDLHFIRRFSRRKGLMEE